MAVIKGLKKLSDRLNQLDKKLAGKALRNATRDAMKPIQRRAKALAPVGREMHRNKSGSIVGPGYMKKQIRIRTRLKKGKATIMLGVTKDAFYGVLFDEGVTISKRKGKVLKGSYRLKPKHWLTKTFLDNRRQIENDLRKNLKKEIDKIT